MADDFKESRNETEDVLEDEKIHDGDDAGHSVQQDSSFLLEMNLLTVLLSSLSVPSEDRLNCDEEERKVAKANGVKACGISRIRNKRRETNEIKLGRRSYQRVQPIKDLRHSRKM